MAYKRFFTGLLFAVALIATYSFVAYDDPIDKIKQQLDKWTDKNPVEKVYLHLDKPYYAAGDDIWFKAYVTEGSYHELSDLSGVVNVELLDWRDSVKQFIKLPLTNGTAAGDFALPDTLSAGNYHIRAYTNYMRNAGSEYFFNRPVSIVNSITTASASTNKKAKPSKSAPVNITPAKPDVQFFPEGGNLVNGIESQVAFKAIDASGMGADVKGTITDNKGKQVAAFSSTHLGMGKFTFVPMAGNTYSATVTVSGQQLTIPLPKALEKGYVLNITDANADNLDVRITTSRALLQEAPNRLITLVGQSAGKIYYAGKSKPGIGEFNTRIAKNKFPSGIAQFTLFSASGEALNERLVFIQNPDRLKLSITADKQTYASQQKVKLNFAANNGDQPAAGSFSVAVTDESKVPVDENSDNNIMASLLLTSDLKGYVEKPAYYFNNPTAQTRTNLDVLMLTQGYRRFDWKEIMNDRFTPPTYTAERSLKVSGTVTTTNGKPVAGGKVQLIDIDDVTFTLDTLTDADGKFAFNNLAFADSIRFIVQARNAKNKKDVEIHLDSIAPPNTAGNAPKLLVSMSDSLTIYSQSSKQLYDMQRRYGVGNHVISLQEVIIREKKIALKHSANLNGPGNADQVIYARDLRNMGCIRIADCLQGRLLGVIFRNGIPYSTRGFRPMLVIVDGVYVSGDYLNVINYNDVQAIEVLRNVGSAAIYGGRAANGVLIVTTKRGDDNDNQYDGPVTGRGIKAYYPKGYYQARTFYSPQYDQPKENKQLADLRSTIYWKPDLNTGKDGKASFEYFNAGGRGIYRVVVEGIDSNGNLGRQVYRYRVE
jgi:TonB-dependent SusC/RagA subfamily outer membrane receptor